MTAAEIRGHKVPADAIVGEVDYLRLIFEVMVEIAAQLAAHNERENEKEERAKLRERWRPI